jgi:peptidoglycan/LPS O-acetylase OafA/YrhL
MGSWRGAITHRLGRNRRLNVAPHEAFTTLADSRTPLRYRSDIDGLRAIAVTSVVLFHAGVWPFRAGFVGVDIFFVISGFLIGGIIVRGATTNSFSFGQFYARRARRIVPALILVLAVTALLGSLTLPATEFSKLGKSIFGSVLGASNIQFWRDVDYFNPDAKTNPLLMTWSLGVEEQFYLVFPWIVLLFAKRPKTHMLVVLVAISIASLALSLWATAHYPKAAFYLLPPRAWELGVGAILAILRPQGGERSAPPSDSLGQEVLGWAGLVITIGSLVVFNEHTPFPGLAAVLPVAGAAALIAAEGSVVNRQILSLRPVVLVGLVSYSWYLWHWPLMTYLRISSPVGLSHVALAGAGLLAFGLAYLSWRFVEQPLRRPSLSNPAVLWRYAGVIAAVVAGVGIIGAGHGWPERLPPEAARIEQVVSTVHADPCLAGWGQRSPNLSPSCVSASGRQPVVAVIGDSHAAALGPGVRRLASASGWGAVVFAKSSCRPLGDVTIWRLIEPHFAGDCAAFRKAAFNWVLSHPDVKTVLLVGNWSGPLLDEMTERYADVAAPSQRTTPGEELLNRGLTNATETLVAAGKDVVLVGDTPIWRFDPAQVALTTAIGPRRLVATLANTRLSNETFPQAGAVEPQNPEVDRIVEATGHLAGARYMNLFPTFCDGARCRFRDGEALLFADPSHLSVAGADYALRDMRLVPTSTKPTSARPAVWPVMAAAGAAP